MAVGALREARRRFGDHDHSRITIRSYKNIVEVVVGALREARIHYKKNMAQG